MDWATFFKDYGQSLFTLGGVFLGSLITLVVSFLNNWFQSGERAKDREAARREAKIQITTELMKNDIRIIEESIDNDLKSFLVLGEALLRKKRGELSDEEMFKEIYSINGQYFKLRGLSQIAEKLAYSFGDELYSEYRIFDDCVSKMLSVCVHCKIDDDLSEEMGKLGKQATQSGGKLHGILTDILISIGDVMK